MHTVTVSASRPYAVHIGGGLLDRAGELLAGATKSRRCAVVTDSAVGPLYGDRVLDGPGEGRVRPPALHLPRRGAEQESVHLRANP